MGIAVERLKERRVYIRGVVWRLQRVYAVSSVPGRSLRSQAALPDEFAIGLSGLVGLVLAVGTATSCSDVHD